MFYKLKKLFLLMFFLLPLITKGQQLVSATDLMKHVNNGRDTTYVIGFWATWCEPCIREFPVFEQLNQDSGTMKIKVLLISIDKENKLNNVVVPFVRNHNLKSKAYLLQEPKEFIHHLYSSWKGDLPLTIIYNPLMPEAVKIITNPVKKGDLNFLKR